MLRRLVARRRPAPRPAALDRELELVYWRTLEDVGPLLRRRPAA